MNQPRKIKILSCKDQRLWYKDHIGEEFWLARVETNSNEYWWTREKEPPYCLNWIAKEDAELLKSDQQDDEYEEKEST